MSENPCDISLVRKMHSIMNVADKYVKLYEYFRENGALESGITVDNEAYLIEIERLIDEYREEHGEPRKVFDEDPVEVIERIFDGEYEGPEDPGDDEPENKPKITPFMFIKNLQIRLGIPKRVALQVYDAGFRTVAQLVKAYDAMEYHELQKKFPDMTGGDYHDLTAAIAKCAVSRGFTPGPQSEIGKEE